MNGLLVTICFILFRLSSALPQRGGGSDPVDLDNLQFSGPSFNFDCPEPNGLFADKEQCDLYYHCEDGQSESILCPDGLLFDDSIRNHEKCVLPHGVDCGNREFVQAKQDGIDERCERAYGMFDHEDPAGMYFSTLKLLRCRLQINNISLFISDIILILILFSLRSILHM